MNQEETDKLVGQLTEQGHKIANFYMKEGKKAIDNLFGDGYAEKHPELLAAFMKVAGDDFNSSTKIAAIINPLI